MNRFSKLFKLAGITGLIAGALYLISLPLTMTIASAYPPNSLNDQLQFASQNPLSGIIHGLGVLALLLIVPLLGAVFVKLKDQSPSLTYLGVSYGMFWLVLGIVGHLIRTSPLKEIAHEFAAANLENKSLAATTYLFSSELWLALARTGGALAAVSWLFLGRALAKEVNMSYKISGWLGQLNFLFYAAALGTGVLGLSIQNAALGLTLITLSVGLLRQR